MNVFKSITGTLQSVQLNVSQSLKRLSSTEKKIVLEKDTVNFDAGADLLNRFQQYWIELHKNSEENASKAEEVDSLISDLYLRCEKSSDIIKELSVGLNFLPELISNLEGITKTLATINTQCEETEQLLTELENVCEEHEIELNKQNHRYQLAKYKELKQSELEKFKVVCAQEHASKVKDLEAKRLEHLHARQQALEEAFTQDMEHYKTYGSSPRQVSISSAEQVDIGEIKIDDDEQELDAFLDTIDKTDQKMEPAQEEVFELDDEYVENVDLNIENVTVAEDDVTAD